MNENQPLAPSNIERIANEVSGVSWNFEQGDVRHFQMRIDREGVWYYLGSPIMRPQLVKLFSTALRREDDGRYWLVTPAERGLIDVDDVPFLAVEVNRIPGEKADGSHDILRFRTNLDSEIECGKNHPIRVETNRQTLEPRPYIVVRDTLEARLTRAVFYELADLAQERVVGGHKVLGVWSKGIFYPLGPAEMDL